MAPSKRELSTAVLAAVADREGVDETDLPERLYDAIDPDALDALFRHARGEVTFEYLDYVVTVDHQGNVDITPADER